MERYKTCLMGMQSKRDGETSESKRTHSNNRKSKKQNLTEERREKLYEPMEMKGGAKKEEKKANHKCVCVAQAKVSPYTDTQKEFW